MISLLTHSMAGIVGIVIGAYGWYRWGSSVKADVEKIETTVTDFKGNKQSSK